MHYFFKKITIILEKKVLIQISWLLRKPADLGPNFFRPHDGPRFKVEYGVYSFVKNKQHFDHQSTFYQLSHCATPTYCS